MQPCCTADVNGMTYTILTVQRRQTIGNEFETHTAQGEYLVIEVDVHNNTNKGANVSSSDFKLNNDSGQEFDPAEGSVSMDVQGAFFLNVVNPGNSRSGTLVFDVPASTAPWKYGLKVFGNASTDSVTIRLPQSS